jgi:hypothetical protein
MSKWKNALKIYLPVRIMASLVAIFANSGIPSNVTIPAGGYSKPEYSKLFEAFFGVWERSDALWYFHIARDGYQAGSSDSVFLPLYPLLIRVAHLLTGLPWLFAGLLVSNIAFIVALRGFWTLVEMDFGSETAERSCWYLALFPGSFFFLAPYTESLFLALSVWAFVWARKKSWFRACVVAFFLSLTRNLGVVIVLPLAVEFLLQVREKQMAFKKCAYLLMPLLSWGLLSLYFYSVDGDALAWVHHQDMWGRRASLPWVTLFTGLKQAWDYLTVQSGAVYLFEAVSVLGVILLLIWNWLPSRKGRRIPLSYFIFSCLMIGPPLLAPYPSRMLMSSLRFMAVIFPAFIILGDTVRKQATDQWVKVIFSGLYSAALGLYVSNQNMF